MIHFKMKILSYNSNGSYLVEYIPDDNRCTTIILNISIPATSLHDNREVLALLKNASPQDYWNKELFNDQIDQRSLQQLVNTTYEVKDVEPILIHNPVGNFSLPSSAPIHNPGSVRGVGNPGARRVGRSSPEQIASPEEQNRIKMKILIQEVLQEMAEGTV